MMMCHPVEFHSKKICSSVDLVETVTFDVSPDCDLEDSKPIFLHDTVAHDNPSPYQAWLQKVQQRRRYHPDEQSPEF